MRSQSFDFYVFNGIKRMVWVPESWFMNMSSKYFKHRLYVFPNWKRKGWVVVIGSSLLHTKSMEISTNNKMISTVTFWRKICKYFMKRSSSRFNSYEEGLMAPVVLCDSQSKCWSVPRCSDLGPIKIFIPSISQWIKLSIYPLAVFLGSSLTPSQSATDAKKGCAVVQQQAGPGPGHTGRYSDLNKTF